MRTNLARERLYDRRRSRRARTAKPIAKSSRAGVRELELLRLANDAAYPVGVRRPMTRSECIDSPRPCPFVACEFHLYLDVYPGGSLKVNFPDLEPWEIEESCALDVADGGEVSQAEISRLMNMTRERIRQLEEQAVRKFERNARLMGVEFEKGGAQ